MEAQDITSRYFPSHVSMPDGNLAIPLTQIEFTYGRNLMMDTVNAIPHALASPDTLIMEEATFQSTMNSLTTKSMTDFFINRKLCKTSKWSQISMLITSKLKTAGVLSILKQSSGTPICGPPILKQIDDNVISPIDFTQHERDTEVQQFQTSLNSYNRINNTVCDLLISSIQPDAEPSNSLFSLLVTNHLIDPDHNAHVPASHIFDVLSKYFIEKMGTCEQIKSKCLTISTTLPRNSNVNLFDSELQFLFSDYKFRESNKIGLDDSTKISYLVTAFNIHPDLRMRMCASDISLKLRTDPDLTYDRAVIILTHVENDILAHELNATLASTISTQYNQQSDHYAASSLQHEERVNMIQFGRKRSRNQYHRQSMADILHERRRHEDPDAPPRMNHYGYDGPNRHQFGGNKIPIPDRFFNPQPSSPRYPQMQAAPPAPRSPRFSSRLLC